jgi:hypothetical protein
MIDPLHMRRAARLGWLTALWLAGCVSVPEAPRPMCAKTSDCDTDHSEVCDEGVCWGNPPQGPFAAVLAPPSARHDLVPRELSQIAIPDDGWFGDLALESAVRMTGRVIAFCPPPMTGCEADTLAATITVSRPSQFPGGPGFTTVATVDAGASGFTIAVPRARSGDVPYTVTVVAGAGIETQGGNSAALPLPPLHFQVGMLDNTTVKTELGGLDLPVLSGTLTDAAGRGLAQYRVAALGRWDPADPAVEVSTVDFTDASGAYAVTLSDDLVGTVELVARPTGKTVAPTVHLANIDSTRSSSRSVMVPTTLGVPRTVTVEVTGVDRSGMITPVSGALVSVAGAATKTLTSFTVNDDESTDDKGIATLQLLDGIDLAGSYRLSITPPAGSSLGMLFDQKLVNLSALNLRLGARIPLSGKILDSAGNPLSNVSITARPSLRFLWTLDAAPQAFVAAIPAATAVTTLDTGEFVVWVDANVAQVWGHYDLLIEPPPTARAPTYLKSEVEIPRDGTLTSVSLGEITLPEPAFVHGRITTAAGDWLQGAELKLYQVVSAAVTLCSEVAHAPASCPIPSQLRGRGASDSDGIVRMTLPR